ncbi:response regulator transcription factor [Paenibacillus sp. PSB04]|uniref:response regulator transcription factor n=1 Tax=Paenibacillus sp. PSB04 TaxID=2866810 RepID=UPI0021F17C90|nr:response regulator transcription factor [Paenibacillus sp. PSB04]UYO05677.1 response regulator transcription factor [Paenibacillus sp. PSB04]
MWTLAIVDDDRQVLGGMSRLIPWEQLGIRPIGEAMDGEEGLRLIRAAKPDIVITDIYMPVMNGLEMIEQLRKQQFDGKIIILSGYSDFDYARKALRLQVDDYLPKPASPATIREVLQRVIAELSEKRAAENREQELQDRLMQYEPYLEREWVKSVLTGGTFSPPTGPYRMLDRLGWKGAQFMMLALEIKRQGRTEGISARDWHLFRFAVGNTVEELARQDGLRSYFLELHSHHMTLLLYKPLSWPAEAFRSEVLALAGRIIESVDRYLQVKLRIGAGLRKDDWTAIADSTEEAFQALAERREPDANHPCVYVYTEAGFRHPAARNVRPVRFFQEMADAVRTFDEPRALLALEDFASSDSGVAQLSPSELAALGTQLFAILSFTLYDTGHKLDDELPPADLSKELGLIENAQQWKAWVAEKVKRICRRFTPNENLKHKETVEFIIQYIHEHYAENIHLQDVADQVYISKNYLSTLFRQFTGETFGDYLTRVRMEKAKSMVLEKKLLIAEIAERVGYRNVPYFTTLFKKHTGRSPTEFYRA